ncbi:substrate-binding domain-containing protein [Nakamurella sp. GG22]
MSSRHASDGGRRGIAPWIIVTLVSAVVLAAAAVVYLLVVGGDDNDAASTSCTSDVVLEVVASPGSAAAIKAAAAAFDATNPVARSACVTTSVTTASGSKAEQALAEGWTAQSSPAPALWVPDSEADLLALEEADSSLTAGRDQNPLATSPVVLAVRDDDADAVKAASLSWQDLPEAAGSRGSLRLPGGDRLIVALPDPTENRATSYALQSVIAGDAGTVDVASVTAAAPQLAATAAGGPRPEPALTQDALTALAAGNGEFSSVPVVQSDLTGFSVGTPGLTAIEPSGPTVGDAAFAVPLTASWVTPALDDAAAAFVAYLRGEEGDAAFTAAGLELVDSTGPASAGASPGSAAPGSNATSEPPAGSANGLLPDAGAEVAAALAAAIKTPPAG